MNILYIDPFLKKRQKTYQYYGGTYHQLKKISNCYLYERRCRNIAQALESCPFRPNAIIFGLGWFGCKIFGEIKGLNGLRIPVLCQLFKHDVDLEGKLNFCKVNKIDVILSPVPQLDYYRKETGRQVRLFMYGFDPTLFKDRSLEKVYDFGFSGALHGSKYYPSGTYLSKNIRARVQDLLSKRSDLNCFLGGSDSVKDRINSYVEYAKRINQSKVWLASTCSFGDISPRWFEVSTSKTLLFCNTIPKDYQGIFRDGINCIQFSENLDNFLTKLYYYLKNDNERQKIVNAAYEEFHSKHTWKHRAEQLIQIIKEV